MQQVPTFEVKTIKEDQSHGQFTIEPLEHGLGHTMGNALRRVLLASFKGAAITQVKVKGVTHKFSTLEGMTEDMVDLMLNLKEVKVAYDQEDKVTAKLSAKGPGTVKAGQLITPASVKVVNPELEIAKLANDAKLEMELTIETGYGYLPAEGRESDTVGLLPLDAIFSPVERVSYEVESTRVGRRTDFDRIIIDIYTDGSQSPLSVLKDAARILAGYFTQVYDPQQVDEVVGSDSQLSRQSTVSVDELSLPTRVANALKNADYLTAEHLEGATDKDLKNVKNLGSKSIELVDKALRDKGFSRSK